MVLDEILEKRIKVLIDSRGYRIIEREDQKEGVYFLLETKDGKRLILWAIPTSDAVGVSYVNQLIKGMKERDVDGGMIIAKGSYTQAARTMARKNNIELIPATSLTFSIFDHFLVPVHQILTPEEREEVLKKYRVKPYQLPRIKASDPVVRAIGAKPGDILKIIRDSPTAGKYVSYRYVIEG